MNEKINEIQIFENPEFGEVRTMVDGKGDVLFCGLDVANALGYSNNRDALNRHCKYVVKHDTPTSGGVKPLSYIYEPDIYRLIVKSKLPEAQKFEDWLFTEVLPAIRKHGMYLTTDTIHDIFNDPEKFKNTMESFLDEHLEKIRLQRELELAQPKVEYYDKIIDSSLLTNFRTAAKELEVKPMLFIKVLLVKGYLFRNARKVLYPYQQFVDSGLFEVKEFCNNGYAGTQTLLTPRGREHFMKLFKELTTEHLWEIELTDVGEGGNDAKD